MVVVPDDIKSQLKLPLGRIGKAEELKSLAKKFKIIAVGDITSIKCLENGIRPYISVFDFFYMRKELDEKSKAFLTDKFPRPVRVTNPPGSITEDFVSAAKSVWAHGGAIRVEGEEDLTALVMIALADSNTMVIYGQPNEGLVFVEPDDKIRTKAKTILTKLGLFI